MYHDLKSILPADFAPTSKVWIYQAARKLSMQQALYADGLLQNFVETWKTHGAPVKGFATILFGQFVIVMADETMSGVSGCSTDSSVKIIKQIELETGINMFDRQLLAFIINDTVQLLPLSQFKYAIEHEKLAPSTIYFNNTVSTKEALLNNWMIPVSASWLGPKIKQGT